MLHGTLQKHYEINGLSVLRIPQKLYGISRTFQDPPEFRTRIFHIEPGLFILNQDFHVEGIDGLIVSDENIMFSDGISCDRTRFH